MKYLFLDIDGVLNSMDFINFMVKYKEEHDIRWKDEVPGRSEYIDPRAVERVIHICKQTGAKVIISSSWRRYTYDETIEDFQKYIDLKPLIPYIAGITPRLSTLKHRARRGEEIQYFLDHSGNCEIYCILDDDSDMLDVQLPYFIQTDFEHGLDDNELEKVISILE